MVFSMYDPKLLEGVRTIHFIGCGGSGTYPLIQILHSRGYAITGSDVEETKNTEAERALGVRVCIGHDAANVGNADLVVYSAAIHDDNPELQAARARGIKAVERSVMLGYISRTHAQSIGVAGTHGKTTTTGMITTMLELAGRDPAAVIGGKLPLIGGYGKAGSGQSVVIEACEYHETFLHLTCAVGVILNIDNDHLEYYGTMGKLKLAFQKFALLSRTVVFNMDDKNTMDVVNSIDRPVLSFGIEEEARFRAVNIGEYKPGFFEFDVLELGEHFAHIKLGVPGYHNIYNALAMCCCVRPLGLKPEDFTNSGERVTYHASCHLCRGLGVKEAPRELIADAAQYVPCEEEEVCCGFGGTYSMKFPEISAQLLDKKLKNVRETRAARLVVDCPGCVMQLRGGAEKTGLNVKVQHIAELLAENLKR